MKNLSFGKLMAIFVGSLCVFIIGTVMILKMSAGSKQNNTVVSRNYQKTSTAADALAEQIRLEQQANASREMYAKQTEALQKTIQEQNRVFARHLENVSHGVNALEMRLAELEHRTRPTQVDVIKPKRHSSISSVKRIKDKAVSLASLSGYKV